MPPSTIDRVLGQPGRDPGVLEVPAEQVADGPPVQRPGGRVPSRRSADRRPARRDPGRDRVVDALAGHRVDQPGGVAGEQQPAVRLLPPPARQRQVVTLPVVAGRDRAGQQLLELVEQQGPRRRVTVARRRQQLAVPDVGEPVAAVEGPGVRRLAAVAVPDHLGAAPVRRRRRVAADGQRPAAVRQPEVRRGPRECAPSAPTTIPGEMVPSRTIASGTSSRRRCDPVPAERRAAVHRPLDQPGVEDLARDDVDRPGHRPGHRLLAAGELEPGERRPAVLDAGDADRGERVEECGAMPSPQDLSRGKSARSSSSTRSDGSACSAAERGRSRRPARRRRRRGPSSCRPVLIAPTPAWHVHQRHRDRGPERRPAVRDQRHRGQAGGDDAARRPRPRPESTGAPTTITTAAATSTAAATTGLQRAPSRCGRPRTPVAASSARSGSTLTKCAPTPSSAPASGSQSGGTWSGLSVRETNTGRPPNATAYGSHDQARGLGAEVVGPAGGDADQVDDAGQPAAGQRQRDRRERRRARRRPGRSARTPGRRPAACPAGRPRGRGARSMRSLDQPIESWPVSTAATTSAMRRRARARPRRRAARPAG